MDTVPLQAILLHHIGVTWSRLFKEAFCKFFESSAWKKGTTKKISRSEGERREYFLGHSMDYRDKEFLNNPFADPKFSNCTSIYASRLQRQALDYFMNQLSASDGDAIPYSEDEEELRRSLAEERTIPKWAGKNLKQNLLHLMSTESLLNVTLYGKNTVVTGDFAKFGSSLPHSSILATLKFFGVSESWISFFEKVLETPLNLDDDQPPKIRRRGVPNSFALSDLFGEVMLFCVDFAVSEHTDGLFLYRIHDDFWFWHHESSVCAAAWKSILHFTELFGLAINPEKTGSVGINCERHPDLPQTQVQWGFLTLENTGRLVIDQKKVDKHISDVKTQLDGCKSILEWVQAYNKYLGFFYSNFASPANCFGLQHIDQIEQTMRRIHTQLFPEHDGVVTRYLSSRIESRFGVKDIPSGWFFWPTSLGGLELKNPFVNIIPIRSEAHEQTPPEEVFQNYLAEDIERYEEAKRTFETKDRRPRSILVEKYGDEPFMSLEEWSRGRELRDPEWCELYNVSLSSEMDEWDIDLSDTVEKALGQLSDFSCFGVQERGHEWDELGIYWKCVLAVWGDEVVEKWGGVEVVRKGALPVGMMSVWRNKGISSDSGRASGGSSSVANSRRGGRASKGRGGRGRGRGGYVTSNDGW
jgi:hypothetical protein